METALASMLQYLLSSDEGKAILNNALKSTPLQVKYYF